MEKRKDTQDQQYCFEAAKKIIKLLEPTKHISVSRLMYIKKDPITDVGKAARNLYEAMDKAGLVRHDRNQSS